MASFVVNLENAFSSPENREGKTFSPVTFGLIFFVHAMAFIYGPATFSVVNFWLFFWLYVLTGLGVTFGLHRYFTHNSFRITNRFVLLITFLASTLAMQGDVVEWVVDHFKHHLNSDGIDDTHSPHQDTNKFRGFLWSHFVWLFYGYQKSDQQNRLEANLLNRGKIYRFFGNKKNFLIINIVSAILIYALFGFGGLIWGFFVRTVFVWHITWLVNSASHLWGFRDYDTTDLSRNCWWVALLTFGEGWHNNHHYKQNSPRHGLKWWQFDITYYLIWSLSKLGMVKIS